MGLVDLILEAILDRRLKKRHNQATAEVLIKWVNLPEEDAAWELWPTIQQRFPDFQP